VEGAGGVLCAPFVAAEAAARAADFIAPVAPGFDSGGKKEEAWRKNKEPFRDFAVGFP